MLLSLFSHWWFQYFLEPFLHVRRVIFLHHLSQHHSVSSCWASYCSELSPELWCLSGSSCITLCSWMTIILMLNFWALWTSSFNLAVLVKVWTLKVEIHIVRLLFNIGTFCLVFANFSSDAIPGTTGCDSCLSAWQPMRHEFCVILFIIIFFRLLIWDFMDATTLKLSIFVILFNLACNKKKLYKVLDYWSRDRLDFAF